MSLDNDSGGPPPPGPPPTEPPYGLIKPAWLAGNVIPFLGAGASLVGRPGQDAEWSPGCPFLPGAAELSRFLAKAAKFPSTDPHEISDLAKVTSYVALRAGRRGLRAALREVFFSPGADARFQPGPLHRYIAGVPCHQLIISTNYDNLMEAALRTNGKPYDLMVYPADHAAHRNDVLWQRHNEKAEFVPPNKLSVDFDRTIVFKMHGSVSEIESLDSFLITEEDYVDFLYRMTARTAIPPLVLDYLANKSFLFLGYGLKDWNLRLILQNLSDFLSERVRDRVDSFGDPVPSWAIQKAPSQVEVVLWEKRNVQIFNQDLEAFAAGMSGA
jgi:hypothetical protein